MQNWDTGIGLPVASQRDCDPPSQITALRALISLSFLLLAWNCKSRVCYHQAPERLQGMAGGLCLAWWARHKKWCRPLSRSPSKVWTEVKLDPGIPWLVAQTLNMSYQLSSYCQNGPERVQDTELVEHLWLSGQVCEWESHLISYITG